MAPRVRPYEPQRLRPDGHRRGGGQGLQDRFNHPGEPPADGLEGRRLMQSAPRFRKDLNLVVEAPNGDFVAYAGVWHVPANRIGYIEPVATDPDYRRMGLGRAAALECVRRCADLGATVVFVESAQPFYIVKPKPTPSSGLHLSPDRGADVRAETAVNAWPV